MGYKEKANQARKKVLEMIHRAGTSHIASNFSVIDLATVLYENVDLTEDRVVWSKGWAAATIYYFLAQKGVIPKEDLEKFPNEPYIGLAEPTVKGVEVHGGSMGHGLPVAVGMALGKKRAKEEGTIYCIMSDGEMQEGTTWEAALVARQNKLNNLVVIIDHNKWCAMGRISEVADLEPFESKWLAFNWRSKRIDGHNYELIKYTLEETKREAWYLPDLKEKVIFPPIVIIADTIKGKGVSFFEDHLLYHYKHVDDEEFKRAMEELNA